LIDPTYLKMRLFYSCLALLVLCCGILVQPTEAHVRLLFSQYAIRNAANARADGAYSVAGPCGGANTFKSNGLSVLQAGQTVSITIAYNGGHQDSKNQFRAMMRCSDDEASLGTDAPFKLGKNPTANPDNALYGGLTSPSTQGVYYLKLTSGDYAVTATDSSTSGYQLTFQLPSGQQITKSTKCVISVADQRDWGGCVDVDFRLGTGTAGGTVPVTTVDQTRCQFYCDLMINNCKTAPWAYANKDACLATCAGFNPGSSDEYDGDTLECRIAHALFVAQYGDGVHCGHAWANSTLHCLNPPTMPAPPSPCSNYCDLMSKSCSSAYTSRAQCLSQCAQLPSDPVGKDQGVGNNVECRIAAVNSSAPDCMSASFAGKPKCEYANPLIVGKDTISAYYTFNTCDRSQTIGTCCCYTGNLTLIHKAGELDVNVNGKIRLENNRYPNSGNYYCGGTNKTLPLNIPDSTDVSFKLSQTKSTSLVLKGTVQLGNDPFEVTLVDGDQATALMTIVNVASSTPQVCSVNALVQARIDTSSLGAASARAQVSIIQFALAFITLYMVARFY